MALHEDVIFSDPVLQRVILGSRRFAPKLGRESIVNCAVSDLPHLILQFQKADSAESCERVAALIRRRYYLARLHSDGYQMDALARLVKDGCDHVMEFEHRDDGLSFLNIDYRARAAYRHRYAYRPGVPARRRSRRA